MHSKLYRKKNERKLKRLNVKDSSLFSLFVILLAIMALAVSRRTGQPTTPPLPDVAGFQLPSMVANFISFGWPIHRDDYLDLSSPFGERDPIQVGGFGDDFHDGLDLYGIWRARIVSISDGQVVCHFIPPNARYSGHSVFGGLVVVHSSIGGQDFWIRYGHLSDTTVHEGDKILEGDLIGRQGATGACEEEHLHIEIIRGGYCDTDTGLIIGGQSLNPLLYMRKIDD